MVLVHYIMSLDLYKLIPEVVAQMVRDGRLSVRDSQLVMDESTESKIPFRLKKPLIPDHLIALLRKKGLDEASLQIYRAHMAKIGTDLFRSPTFVANEYLSEEGYARVTDYLNGSPFGPIMAMVLLDLLLIDPTTATDPITSQYAGFYQSRYPTKATKPKKLIRVTWDEIVAKCEEYGASLRRMLPTGKVDPFTHRRYLALCLYTKMPPLRPSDWLGSKLVELDPQTDLTEYTKTEANYLDFTSGKLVLTGRKGGKRRDLRIIEVPKDLLEIIRTWAKLNKSDYLFESRSKGGSSMSPSAFRTFIHGIEFANGHLSPNNIRTIFISTFIMDGQRDLAEREATAKLMGYKITTHKLLKSQRSAGSAIVSDQDEDPEMDEEDMDNSDKDEDEDDEDEDDEANEVYAGI